MGASVTSYGAANDRPSGGCAAHRNLDTNATGDVVKASPGRLYGWHLGNKGAAAAYVKLYDKASAPTEADTPLLTIQVPLAGASDLAIPAGIAFVNGISVRATTGIADNDTTAPATNQVVAAILYA